MSRPRGFTLVEVVVALAVSALVVLLAHRTLTVAGDLGGRLEARRAEHDRAMNARRFLDQAFGSLNVGSAPNRGFDGNPSAARFTTWLPSPSGTPRRRVVRVLLVPEAGLLALAEGDTLVLVPGAHAVAFDYLMDLGADAAWVQGWRSPASAPLAVRLRVAHGEPTAVDTLLFLIGPRG